MLAPCSAASVSDGLSHTAAFSEKLRGRAHNSGYQPRTDLVLAMLSDQAPLESIYHYCATELDLRLGYRSETGLTWMVGSLAQTCYNHIQGPNDTVPDCIWWASPPQGLVGARSNHPGGVHVTMADGSVWFVSSTIERSLWMALGTRGGGEVINDNDL
jgi:prepilin-type processing-associated H-X9-DG protein